jgi:hypothetical protein
MHPKQKLFEMGVAVLEVPAESLSAGFINDPVGTHGSRTIMLSELQDLLDAVQGSVDQDGYRTAIIDDNVLHKQTISTRKESFRRLRELYSLDQQVVLFPTLRELWNADVEARPLLALLCACARDPILRATASLIFATPEGERVTPHQVADAANAAFPGRWNPTMLANIGRHAASSWQQSGHLEGRAKKIRSRATARPCSTAYALLLGHLCGIRGEGLFETFWVQLLDASPHVVREQADVAARQGWIDLRRGGGVTEIEFSHLLESRRGA